MIQNLDSSFNSKLLNFDVDLIEKDVHDLIKKHYNSIKLTNLSLISDDGLGKEKGFYLVFIKRNGIEERKITTTSFGCDIKIHEIMESVSKLLSDIMKGEDINKIGRA